MALATGKGRTVEQPGFSPDPHCALTRDLLLSPSPYSPLEAVIKPLGQQKLLSALRKETLPHVRLLSVQALGVMLVNSCSAKRYRMALKPLNFTGLVALVHRVVNKQRLDLGMPLMFCNCNGEMGYICMLIVGLEFFCF